MTPSLFSHFAAACGGGNFLSFPHWYEYLKVTQVDGVCTPQVNGLNDIWLIVAAVIEILIHIAAIAAIIFVIYSGYEYQMSRGEPDKTAKARGMLINSLVGLVIAVISAGIVTLVAGSVH